MTDLGSLGNDSVATGINNAAQVVGFIDMNRPFLWEAGEMSELGSLGGDYGVAYGINDAGQVVGSSVDVNGTAHAVLWATSTNFSSPTPQLLAQLNGSDSGWSPNSISRISNTFTMDTGLLSNGGEAWDLGDGVWLNGSGITNFSTATDRDYAHIVALLADGMDESIDLQEWEPGGGGGGVGAFESVWFSRQPDFLGYQIDYIRLNTHDLSLTLSQGGTQIYENHTWEIWGHRLFVAFYPPTDADGAYLVDRNYTNVNVSLAEPGTATLNWDGANQSMVGGGTTWSVNVSGLPNGVHRYEVYAQNPTGSVFSTGVRQLTVGVGVWTKIPFQHGFQPSLQYDAGGRLHACFGGANLTYALLDAGSWRLTNVAVPNDYSFCSLALDLSGHPEIAYSSNLGVMFVGYNGSAWASSLVSPTRTAVPSLAVDPLTNRPRIAYSDLPNNGLMLASYDNGAWTNQVVAPGYTGFNPSLAIDSQGQAHIAYYDPRSRDLMYASGNGPGWSLTVVDTPASGATQGQISLRLDANDVPHIGYIAPTGLKYATFKGTNWTSETVDVKTFSAVSLSLDALGRPRMGYARWGGDVRYAEWNGTWSVQVVSHGAGSNGYDTLGMAVSPAGVGVIIFGANVPFGYLVFATNFKDTAPPSTSASLTGSMGQAGWYRSSVEVILIATDNLRVLNTSYRVDSGAWVQYASPFAVAGDGTHTIQYFSVDVVHHAEPIQRTTFGIDSTGPRLSNLTPSGPLTSGVIIVSWSGDDNVSGIVVYAISVDGGPQHALGLDTSATLSLPDGTHVIEVETLDAAGNSANLTTTVTIDTNIFSPSGPYHGIPSYFLGGLAVAGVAVFLLRNRRRRKPVSQA